MFPSRAPPLDSSTGPSRVPRASCDVVTPSSTLSQAIGKYRVIAPIGRGGMAHIFLARMAGPSGFSKLFVVKVLRDDIREGGDECVTMFLDEARLAARLSHPNIVQTFDVGEADGRYFIAMEYLEGQCLRFVERRLGRHGFPEEQYLRVLAEVARGLHHAHELKDYDGTPLHVVHRDVSPQNVFVTYDGRVKLLDFGIAKAENAEHLTQVGVIKGKVDYIAPEQIRGERVDRRADVFSLGVMLYEALAHVRFAGGSNVSEITKMHDRVTGREAKLRHVREDVPEELARICDRAIALEPAGRYATALELAEDLERYLASAGLRPTAEALAQRMEPAFREERAQISRLVQQQMMLRTSDTSSLPPPALEPELAASASTKRVRWPWAFGIVAAAAMLGGYLALPSSPREARASAGSERALSTPAAARPLVEPLAKPAQREREAHAPRPVESSEHSRRKASAGAPSRRTGRAAEPRRAQALREEATTPPAPARQAEPQVVEPVPARQAEPEPGADFNSLVPTRGKQRAEIELEEDLYE
jgi:serine/threonine protein kinase